MNISSNHITINKGEIRIFTSGSVTATGYQSATGVPHRWTITTTALSATDGFLATPEATGSWLTLATPFGSRFNIAFASSSITSSVFPLDHQGYHGWHTASLVSGSLTANNIASAIHTAISTETIAREAAGRPMWFSSSLASNVVTVDVPITGSSRAHQDPILSSSFGVVIATAIQGTGDPSGIGLKGTPAPGESPQYVIKPDPADSQSLMISGSGGSLFYMSSSGKIGINTKEPTHDFEVVGSMRTLKRSTGTGSIVAITYDKNDAKASVGDNMGGIRWNDHNYPTAATGETAAIYSIVTTANTTGSAGDLIFSTVDPVHNLAGSPREVVRIDTAGKLTAITLQSSGNITGGSITATGPISSSGGLSVSGIDGGTF